MKKNELVHVGTFGQPQGLKGEIKINIFTSSLESFKMLKEYFIENKKNKLFFKKLRKAGNKYICSFEGCEDRNQALEYKGKNIFVFRKNFPKTNHGQYYIVDLIGCKVLNTENLLLGYIVDIKNFGASDLFEINTKNKKNFYIPMDSYNLVSVNIKNKTITVNPLPGLLD